MTQGQEVKVQGCKMSSSSNLRFDGRVALITGAGGGLGREYALFLASRGAKVVVNDLGGDMKGEGKSRAADVVVQEIKAAGGQAVPNYDSVEDGDKLVQTALDNFGRIDIIINNAGILRDRSFARTSDLDWDLIHRIHLRGSFMVTRAAWPHMKKNKYGRIIMTTSAAGIYGNFGQANYTAAKLGLLGLANTLAIEGQKYNIQCNTVAPLAGSRLTATVMPQDIVDALKPSFVAPVVAWLCHEECEDNGCLYETGAGHIAKLRWQKSKGILLRSKNKAISLEAVRDGWEEACDFTEHSYPTDTAESTSIVYQMLLDQENQQNPDIKMNKTSAIKPELAIGYESEASPFSYTSRDVILYALGIGFSTQQNDYLKFLFEMNDEFCVFPTFGVLPVFSSLVSGGAPGLEIDPTQILHGEHYLELYKPFPTNGNLKSKAIIADVLDKGSGAILIQNTETFDESGEKIAFNQFVSFVQRAGGFGGKRNSDKLISTVKPPSRSPDASVKEMVSVDQAALYRLSGDYNPLHIDPDFAAMGGFNKPILHGLASFGFAVKHVLKQYCDNDIARFKAVKVRFSNPVLPGQTIQTDMWKEGDRIHFQTKVVETGKASLTGAYVDLKPANTSASDGSSTEENVSSGPVHMVFDAIKQHISSDPSVAKKTKAVFQWNIKGKDEKLIQYTVDLKNGNGDVYQGEPKQGKPGVTMTTDEDNFIKMASGETTGQAAFLQGKLKLKGNIMLAQKLGTLFAREAKL